MTEFTTRRQLLQRASELVLAGGSAIVLGCGVDNNTKSTRDTPVLQSRQRPEVSQNIQAVKAEVARITKERYDANSIVGKVYSGKPIPDICPVFSTPVLIGVSSNRAYALMEFVKARVSKEKRFSYFLNQNQSLTQNPTVEWIDARIAFSKAWLNAKSDEVKALAMEKEAFSLAQFEGFANTVALQTYRSQGRLSRLDNKVTDAEIARTLARELLLKNPLVAKLYDFAGYLPIMDWAGALLNSSDDKAKQDLSQTLIPELYQRSKDNGISFEGIEFGTQQFFGMAYRVNSPWRKIIEDPVLPSITDSVRT